VFTDDNVTDVAANGFKERIWCLCFGTRFLLSCSILSPC